MSLYGVNLLEGLPLGRFTNYNVGSDAASVDDESIESSALTGPSSLLSHNEGDFVMVDTVAPPPPDDTLMNQVVANVPTSIEVSDVDEQSAISTESDGVLILSSLSSSEYREFLDRPPTREIYAFSPAAPVIRAPLLGSLNPLSVSTIDSTVYAQTEASYSTTRSLLSLRASSLPSSIAASLSVRDSFGNTSMNTGSGNNSNNNNNNNTNNDYSISMDQMEAIANVGNQLAVASNSALISLPGSDENAWYLTIKNEQEWDVFQQELQGILAALGEPVTEEMLAQLIQEEEELLWKMKDEQRSGGKDSSNTHALARQKSRYLTMLGDTAIILAAIAIPAFGATLAMRRTRPFFMLR